MTQTKATTTAAVETKRAIKKFWLFAGRVCARVCERDNRQNLKQQMQ